MNQKRVTVYLFAVALAFGAMAVPGWTQGGGVQPGGPGPDIALPGPDGVPGGGGPGEAARVDPPANPPRDPAGPGPRWGGGYGRGGGWGPMAQEGQPPFGRGWGRGQGKPDSQPPYGPGFRGGRVQESSQESSGWKCPYCENCPYCQRAREGRGSGWPGIDGERRRPMGMMRHMWQWNPEAMQKMMDEMKAGVPPRQAFRRAFEEAGPGGPSENERPPFERFRRFRESRGFEGPRPEGRDRERYEGPRPEGRERAEREPADRERGEREQGVRERADREAGKPENDAQRPMREFAPDRGEGPAHLGDLDGQIERLNDQMKALEAKMAELKELKTKLESAPREEREGGDRGSE